jgi:hypothetical protein
MSKTAIVTFDLHGASSNTYRPVRKRLARMGLRRHITKSDGTKVRLPANTYAKHCRKRGSASEIRDKLKARIKALFRELSLTWTTFVFVADGHAWNRSRNW